jgi:CS domain
VETPEERHRQQVAAAIHQADALLNQEEIFFVLAPADSSQPLQELSFRPARTASGDALLEHLQTTFANPPAEKDIDLELLRQHSPTQTLAAAGGMDVSVSDQTLREVAKQANIETFTLVHPTPNNHFTSIIIYLDEVGMLKRLPLNPRASQFCARAGFNPPPVFYGNVYLGRIRQRPTLRNESFRLGPDTSLDAPWLLTATAENLQHQQAMNERTGRSDIRQVGVAGSDGQAKVEADGAYSWTQTESELELVMPLPADALSKDVRVQFLPLQLTIRYISERTPKHLELPLFERIDVDAGTWTLEASDNEPCKRLIVSMEKGEEAYWPRIRD